MISMDNYDNSDIPDIQDMPVVRYCKLCGDTLYYNRPICDYCEEHNRNEEES